MEKIYNMAFIIFILFDNIASFYYFNLRYRYAQMDEMD